MKKKSVKTEKKNIIKPINKGLNPSELLISMNKISKQISQEPRYTRSSIKIRTFNLSNVTAS
jgi:hypothetical protein